MTRYIILERIKVTDANAIAGFTYGFPAPNAFLGYVHALHRKLQASRDKKLQNIHLSQVGIVCHQHQIHAYRDKSYKPYRFALTRNPLIKKPKTKDVFITPSFNEEGKMLFTVSLIIKAKGINDQVEQDIKHACEKIKELAEQQKLAGGKITDIKSCYLPTITKDSPAHKTLLRRLMPSFVLIDRSDLMVDEEQDKLNKWLSVSSLAYSATKKTIIENKQKKEIVEWVHTNPNSGYIVPLQIGYKAITNTFAAGSVANVRDNCVPVTFVEPVHSLGQWIGAPSKLESIEQILWQFSYQFPFYLCRTLNKDLNHLIDENDYDDFDMTVL